MIPDIDNSMLERLPHDHPLVQRGHENLANGIFISKKRKEKLSNYTNTIFIKDGQTHLILYIEVEDYSERWLDMIKLILWRVRFMRELLKNRKVLYIWIWPTPWKKRVPRNKIFTEDDINSGSTSLFLDGPEAKKNGEIILWRKEEILKVLVHEIIHAFRIDRHDPSPKEAYVELRATLANIYLELLERQLPLSNYPQVLAEEKRFGIHQAKKISRFHPGKTNIHAYLDERNRLLNGRGKISWRRLVDGNKREVPTLRFTIAEEILQHHPRKDQSGNVLIIP